MPLSVLETLVDTTDYQEVVEDVASWAKHNESRYVCVANVHMTMEAYDSSAFRDMVNGADLVVPDGMPLVWMMRLKGRRDQQRVYGPTLMLYILEAAEREGIPVGFYGGQEDVLKLLVEKIQARYVGLGVAYAYSPPFRDLTPEEDAEVDEQINHSGAKILFVGLGCPKQETWMSKHHGKIQAVMLGVGAAFDFYAGIKPQAPSWLQGLGLEWLFRVITEPRRLWKRYLFHNPRFVILAVADLLGLR